jgi:hypothetical protein
MESYYVDARQVIINIVAGDQLNIVNMTINRENITLSCVFTLP